MRDEDRVELGQPDRAQQLLLGALAAVEQDPLAARAQQDRGQPAPRGGHGARGAGEEEREVHGRPILERDQLEARAPVLDRRDPHRVRGRAAALGRRARVEDLEAVALLVQRQVRVAEDDRVGLGEAARIRASRPVRGPASWIIAIRAPAASTVRAGGSRAAAPPCRRCRGSRAPAARAPRAAAAPRAHQVAGVQDRVGGPQLGQAAAGQGAVPRGMWVSETIARRISQR